MYIVLARLFYTLAFQPHLINYRFQIFMYNLYGGMKNEAHFVAV